MLSGKGTGIASCPCILFNPILIKQHKFFTEFASACMVGQVACGAFDYGNRITALAHFDIQMQMPVLLFATQSQKLHESAVTRTFNTDKNSTSWCNGMTRPHMLSTNMRHASEYTGAILGIEPGVPAQTAHILGAMDTSSAIIVLLHNKQLFFLQIIKQANIVRRN